VYPKGLPPRRWLAHFATLFDTVEVNATFYRLPARAAVAGWVEQSPPDFLFAIKASRYLTHIKRLAGRWLRRRLGVCRRATTTLEERCRSLGTRYFGRSSE